MASTTLDGRRKFLATSTAAALYCVAPRSALADSPYPSNSVRVVIPNSAGGGADTLGRILCGQISTELGQAFIVDDRGGGGGTIGAAIVAHGPTDGYTILYDSTSHSVNQALFRKLSFDYRKAFAPVGLAGLVPNLLLVHPSVDAKTVADVIAIGKHSPGGLNWASSGLGGVQWLSEKLFGRMAGIQLNDIPYKGGGPALVDMMGGYVKFYFSNAAASSGYVKSGKLKAIAHTGKGRLASFPDLPPVSDTLPGFETYEWNGVFVPATAPKDVVIRLNKALNAAIANPGVQSKLAPLSVITRQTTPAEFGSFVNDQMNKWSTLLRESNIKPL
jgi:tripartite-type tricarboxylate transporter receptor subunit TctC